MTLTGQLNQANSPLLTFFAQRLSNIRATYPTWRAALAGADTLRPDTPLARYPAGEVGNAVGIRLAAALTPQLPPTVSSRLPPGIPRRWSAAAQFITDAQGFINGLAPHQDWPTPALERDLARYCYVLGLFDQWYRTPPPRRPNLRLTAVARDAEPSAFLAVVPDECLDDMAALTQLARTPIGTFEHRDAVAGPRFAGSADVGDAEADVITDGCLLEIKTTVNSGFEQNTLRQVVAYALLDYDDVYGIDRVAIYMARQGRLVRYGLDEVLTMLASEPVTARVLRTDLAQHMSRTRA